MQVLGPFSATLRPTERDETYDEMMKKEEKIKGKRMRMIVNVVIFFFSTIKKK